MACTRRAFHCVALLGLALAVGFSSQPLRADTTIAEAIDQQVVDVRIVGNVATPLSKIPKLSTRTGAVFDPAVVEEDVRALAKSKKFINVRPQFQQVSGGIVVIFQVVERPLFHYVKYLGNKKVRDKTLTKQTELEVGSPMDPYAVAEGQRKIEQYYREKGYNHVQVQIMEGDKIGDRGAVYVINEGVAQKVVWTKFIGNTIASDSRLRTQIESKPGFIWLFQGYVDRKKIDEDALKITDYYRSLGFFRAKVGRELEFNEKENWLQLTFVIDEGPRYKVRNISVIGNEKFRTEYLTHDMQIKSNEYFDRGKMNKDVAMMKDIYGGDGHVFTSVEPDLRFLEKPGELDLVYTIAEGDRYRVGRINVHIGGENPHTREKVVLNRMTLRPGEIVDTRKLRSDERRIKGSGLFVNEPARGATPKIVFSPPAVGEDAAIAGKPKKPGSSGGGNVRGQSPDDTSSQGAAGRGASDKLIDVNVHGQWIHNDGAPLPPPQPAPADWAPPLPHRTARPLGNDAASAAPVYRGQSPDGAATVTIPPSNAGAVGAPGYYAPPAYAPPTQPAYAPPAPAPAGYGIAPSAQARPVTPNYGGPPVGYSAPPAGYAAPAGIPPSPNPLFAAPPSNANYPPVQTIPPSNVGQPQTVFQGGGMVAGPEQLPPPQHAEPWMNPQPAPTIDFTPQIDPSVIVEETQTGRFMIGVGVNSDAGVVGSVLLEEQNFDWQRFPSSWEEVRNGQAFRGAGQRFRIEAAPGTELQRYSVSFTEPYLMDTPVSLSLSASYFDRRYRDYDETRVGGRAGLGYQLTPDLTITGSVRAESIEISRPRVPTPPELLEVLGMNDLYGFKVGLTHDTRDSTFAATEGHYIEASFEQVVGTFQYARQTLEGRQYFLLAQRPDGSGRHTLSVSSRVGFSGDETPIYDRFFAGGFSTLRGFRYRGASPKNMDVIVGGDFQFLNTVEYTYPITANDVLKGVVFADFGTVEQEVTINEDNFRIAPGFGLRIAVPALGPAPIALDFAFPVAHADTDDRQVFSFFIGVNR